MKEKKLNDTEIDVGMIIKALECMAGITQGDCDKCPFMIDKFCSDTELSKTTLDLIHRLQSKIAEYEQKLEDGELVSKDWHDEQVLHDKAEIERLTEERNDLEQRYLEESKERCEFEQLYKKIQHAHNIGLGSQRVQWEKKVEQAVKDTAKEILTDFDNHGVYSKDYTDFMRKEYGVEVNNG